MAQSLARVLVHVIFATKDRAPYLMKPFRDDLYRYLMSVLQDRGCQPIAVGGVEDHVHLLFALSRTISLAKLVEVVKTSSSKWLKTKGEGLRMLAWQGGYGAFSVSQSQLLAVMRYIRNQEAHHRRHSLEEELRMAFERHEVEYDPERMWD